MQESFAINSGIGAKDKNDEKREVRKQITPTRISSDDSNFLIATPLNYILTGYRLALIYSYAHECITVP